MVTKYTNFQLQENMLKFEFRTADLLDRADWSDPDFPAFARLLNNMSHVVAHNTGNETVRLHVIEIYGERVKKPKQYAKENTSEEVDPKTS